MNNEPGPAPTRRAKWPADRFEVLRPHLRSVGYGILGSRGDAEDAVQETRLRVSRNEYEDIRDLRAWPTTIVGRICLDMPRARRLRREDYPGTWLPEPIVAERRRRVTSTRSWSPSIRTSPSGSTWVRTGTPPRPP
ncbi:sigma factor [Embleya sp. NPDC008237]|uniref:sigma factor n=1 Tax=Embleya sp. NPDC008237 TaxID=3363978 RepID=UPI0036EC543C